MLCVMCVSRHHTRAERTFSAWSSAHASLCVHMITGSGGVRDYRLQIFVIYNATHPRFLDSCQRYYYVWIKATWLYHQVANVTLYIIELNYATSQFNWTAVNCKYKKLVLAIFQFLSCLFNLQALVLMTGKLTARRGYYAIKLISDGACVINLVVRFYIETGFKTPSSC